MAITAVAGSAYSEGHFLIPFAWTCRSDDCCVPACWPLVTRGLASLELVLASRAWSWTSRGGRRCTSRTLTVTAAAGSVRGRHTPRLRTNRKTELGQVRAAWKGRQERALREVHGSLKAGAWRTGNLGRRGSAGRRRPA